MPWHPEELYKHVLILEGVYNSLPNDDTNARQAVAKAVIWAASSFLEGCLQQFVEELCSKEGKEVPNLHGLANRRQFVIKRAKKKKTYSVDPAQASTRFIENDLEELRNKVNHGGRVDTNEFRLDNISFFREAARDYLEQVYQSFEIGKPGWLQ
jgi:hypothetical protein